MEGFFAEIQLSPLVTNSERDWEKEISTIKTNKMLIKKNFILRILYTKINF